MNLADMSRLEARIPGCAKLWTARNTLRLQVSGTSGRQWPEDTSHISWSFPAVDSEKGSLEVVEW